MSSGDTAIPIPDDVEQLHGEVIKRLNAALMEIAEQFNLTKAQTIHALSDFISALAFTAVMEERGTDDESANNDPGVGRTVPE